jgi:hypothetical protein
LHLFPLHPALDDPAHLPELVAVALPGLAVGLEPDAPRQLIPHPAVEVHTIGRALVVEDRVALARESLVQLHRDAT